MVLVCAALLIVLGLNVPAETKVAAPHLPAVQPLLRSRSHPDQCGALRLVGCSRQRASAPRKIAYGMIVAAIGFGVMIFASLGIEPLEAQVTEKFNIDESMKAKTEEIDKEAQKLIDARTAKFNETKEQIQAELGKRQKQVDDQAAAQLAKATTVKDKSEINKSAAVLKANNSGQYEQITEIARWL